MISFSLSCLSFALILNLTVRCEDAFPSFRNIFRSPVPREAYLNFEETWARYGYKGETHYLVTDDGYILKIYRIFPNIRCTDEEQENKLPVVLGHGLLGNSLDWTSSGNGKALGLLLADECYETWYSNFRGNFESRNHTTLSPLTREFWDFTWHEMGKYDLKVIFDFVLSQSDYEQVDYVGHSQGTTAFFVYCSLYPEECSTNIHSMHALSPIAFLGNCKNRFLQVLSRGYSEEKALMEMFHVYEFLPKTALSAGQPLVCSVKGDSILNFCADVFSLLTDSSPKNFNNTMVQIASANDPSGCATLQLLHYAQEIVSGKFRQFDYSLDHPNGNMIKYGQADPPDYNVENIEVSLYFYYSDGDLVADTTDVEFLATIVPNVVLHKVTEPNFTHLDFLFSNKVKPCVNDIVITNLKN